ncbi:zinc transporter [Nannochloropsis oceanica]
MGHGGHGGHSHKTNGSSCAHGSGGISNGHSHNHDVVAGNDKGGKGAALQNLSGIRLLKPHHQKRVDAKLEQRRVRSKLIAATVFAVVFMSVEIVGGVLAGSLAIVTDAAHLFTDVANFITAIMASHLSETPSTSKHSYGLVRAEVLSALINTGVIVMLAAYLIYEGIHRIVAWFKGVADPVDGFLMMVVAIIGVIFNIALMLIFGHEHGHAHDHSHGGGGGAHVGHSHGGHSHGYGHSHAGHDHDEEEEEEEGHEHDEEEGGRSHSHSNHSHGGGEGGVRGGGGPSRHASHDGTHLHDSHGPTKSRASSTSESEKGTLLVDEEEGGFRRKGEMGGAVGASTTYGSLPFSGRQHHHHTEDGDEELTGSATRLTKGFGREEEGELKITTTRERKHSHHHHDKEKKKKRKKKKSRNINLEAAHLHVITDLVQSIGVALAGVIIYFKPHWQVIDPICTILFSIVICYSVVSMLAKSTHVLLEGVPEGVDPDLLHNKLSAIEGVTDVHDLHVWMLSVGRPLVTVHIKAADPDVAMKQAQAIFTQAGIDHITIQIQRDECLPNECAHPCVSLACAPTSPGNTSPGRGGCTYL